MLKNENIRKPQWTPKPKNRKTDLKSGQNRKTENPNVPLCKPSPNQLF